MTTSDKISLSLISCPLCIPFFLPFIPLSVIRPCSLQSPPIPHPCETMSCNNTELNLRVKAVFPLQRTHTHTRPQASTHMYFHCLFFYTFCFHLRRADKLKCCQTPGQELTVDVSKFKWSEPNLDKIFIFFSSKKNVPVFIWAVEAVAVCGIKVVSRRSVVCVPPCLFVITLCLTGCE